MFKSNYQIKLQLSAKIEKIGINPYILLPNKLLLQLFAKAGKNKGAIPVLISINKEDFIQNLVKYSGAWRLYLNGPMRKAAGKDVGDVISLKVSYDPTERSTPMHPKLRSALEKNKSANKVFLGLPTSRQKEIMRYINHLKTAESVERNVEKAIGFLKSENDFIGLEKR